MQRSPHPPQRMEPEQRRAQTQRAAPTHPQRAPGGGPSTAPLILGLGPPLRQRRPHPRQTPQAPARLPPGPLHLLGSLAPPGTISRCGSARAATRAAAPPDRARPRPHASLFPGGRRQSAPGLAGQGGQGAPHRLHSPATPHRSRKHRRSAMGAARPCAASAGVGAAAAAAGLPAPRALPPGCQLRHLCTSRRPALAPQVKRVTSGRGTVPRRRRAPPGAWGCHGNRVLRAARGAAPDQLQRGIPTPGWAALGVKGRWQPRAPARAAAPASVPR